MHKTKFLLVAITLMYSCVSFAQPFAGKIGVGLDGIGGIALEFPNVTLTSTAWQSVATGSNARTDAAGWPLEDFRVVFFDLPMPGTMRRTILRNMWWTKVVPIHLALPGKPT